MKFRRKPTVVDGVFQYWRAAMSRAPLSDHPGIERDAVSGLDFVTTIHGQRAYLGDGDFVLPEQDGKHFYPCKPDVFMDTHERVDG